MGIRADLAAICGKLTAQSRERSKPCESLRRTTFAGSVPGPAPPHRDRTQRRSGQHGTRRGHRTSCPQRRRSTQRSGDHAADTLIVRPDVRRVALDRESSIPLIFAGHRNLRSTTIGADTCPSPFGAKALRSFAPAVTSGNPIQNDHRNAAGGLLLILVEDRELIGLLFE